MTITIVEYPHSLTQNISVCLIAVSGTIGLLDGSCYLLITALLTVHGSAGDVGLPCQT